MQVLAEKGKWKLLHSSAKLSINVIEGKGNGSIHKKSRIYQCVCVYPGVKKSEFNFVFLNRNWIVFFLFGYIMHFVHFVNSFFYRYFFFNSVVKQENNKKKMMTFLYDENFVQSMLIMITTISLCTCILFFKSKKKKKFFVWNLLTL